MAVTYYDARTAQTGIATTGLGIAGVKGVKVVWHDGTAVDADIHNGVIRIPRIMQAAGFTEDELEECRGRVHHEFGHQAHSKLSKAEWPKGALHQIWNAVEDVWMEREHGREWPGLRDTYAAAARRANRRIGQKVMSGAVTAPMWEALVAMMFQSNGLTPAWTLTPKARAYFDAAYDIFVEWRQSKSSRGNLEIARRIHDVLKQVHDDWQDGQGQDGQQGEQGEQGQQQDGQGQGQGGEGQQDGQPQSQATGDFEDEQQGGQEASQGASEDKDGSEQGEGGDEGQDGVGEGQDGAGEGQDGAGEGKDEAGEGKDEAGGEAGGGKGGDETEGEDGKASGKGDGPDMDEELAGPSMSEMVDEAIADAIKRVKDEAGRSGGVYTARLDLDEHVVPDPMPAEFMALRSGVAASVFAITRTLEQALRTLARSRTVFGQRSGDLDMARLAHVAKGLSRNVFKTVKEGQDLDTAVVITIDESGSMDSTVREVQKVVAALGEALSACGVPFEVVGGTTKYGAGDGRMPSLDGFCRSNPIIFRHYKTFGEQWSAVRARVPAIGAFDHYIDGELVDYAASLLGRRRETRKVIISVSDGSPMGGQGTEKELGENLVRVCGRVRAAGIEVYSLAIGTPAPARFYGKEHSIELPSGADLGKEFAGTFAKVITKGGVKVGGKAGTPASVRN
jgi:cobalamin biosynthesis protein CobT